MNIYETMLNDLETSYGMHIGDELLSTVRAYANPESDMSEYEGGERVYPVEGLAVAYSGVTKLAFDIPNHGRTTQIELQAGMPTPKITIIGYEAALHEGELIIEEDIVGALDPYAEFSFTLATPVHGSYRD